MGLNTHGVEHSDIKIRNLISAAPKSSCLNAELGFISSDG